MVFAAVLGQAARKYATWLLQRGTTIGRLDHLMQSRTVISAITTHFTLQAFSPLGFGILLIWALSPIGSQSALRVLSTGFEATTTSGVYEYIDSTMNNAFETGSGIATINNVLSAAYVTALLGPAAAKNGSMDSWGNAKIPFLPAGNGMRGDWYPVNRNESPASAYSSLLGIPVPGLQMGNSSFTIETTYIDLDCTQPQRSPRVAVSYDIMGLSNGTFRGPNMTNTQHLIPSPWDVSVDSFLSPDSPGYQGSGYPGLVANDTGLAATQATLLYQSRIFKSEDSEMMYAISYCKVNQVYVESNITCDMTTASQNCSVVAQRPSKRPHPPKEITYLSFPLTFNNIVLTWTAATGLQLHSAMSTLAEWYIQDPAASSILGNHGQTNSSFGSASLDEVTAQDFSIRLSQLLNTFLLASQIYRPLSSTAEPLVQTNATVTTLREVYTCSWGWVAALLIASFTMLAAALFGIWCGFCTAIPDILGYCSSLPQDSRYSNLQGGGTLDGIERSRLLKNLPVRFGVVDSDDAGVGHLAVASPSMVQAPVRGILYT
jgi:hypothetical protein